MAIDAADFRKVLGQFASGVTVVTTLHEGSATAMTASSFTSVSLRPPLVLFCADKRARTCSAVAASGIFAANILAEDQRDLSDLFAGKGTDADRAATLGELGQRAETGAPILPNALGWVDCRVEQTIDAGDHIIYVGLVVASGVREANTPLVYWRGNYRRLDERS